MSLKAQRQLEAEGKNSNASHSQFESPGEFCEESLHGVTQLMPPVHHLLDVGV